MENAKAEIPWKISMSETEPDSDPRLREILDAFEASQFDDITVRCVGVRLHAVRQADGAVRIVEAATGGGEASA
jgi:hypothetical protein